MPLSPFGNNFCVIFPIAVRNHTGMMFRMISRQSQPQAVFMGLPMRAPGSSGKGIRRDRMDLSGSTQPQGFSEPLGGSCRTNALRGTGVMPFTRQRSKKELGSKLQKGETPNCHFWVRRLSLKQNLHTFMVSGLWEQPYQQTMTTRSLGTKKVVQKCCLVPKLSLFP